MKNFYKYFLFIKVSTGHVGKESTKAGKFFTIIMWRGEGGTKNFKKSVIIKVVLK